MLIRKLTTSLAITTLLPCLALSSAKADESITTTSYTTTLDAPSVATTTLSPSPIVYLRTAPPSLLITTLEGRRSNLEKMIDQARERGDISSEQCAAMKRELQRIAKETSSNTINYSGAVMLAQDLDLIGTQYGTIVTSAPVYIPIIAGSHFTTVNGQILELDDLSVRRADLESRITKDLFQGRLSDIQAADLRAQLSNIGTEAALYRADGNLNFKEARHLYSEFDQVASEIEKLAGKDNK